MRHEIIGVALGMSLLSTRSTSWRNWLHILIFVGIHLSPRRSDQRNRERQRLTGAGTTAAKNVSPSQRIGKRCRPESEKRFSCHQPQARGPADQERRVRRMSAGVPLPRPSLRSAARVSSSNGIGHNGLHVKYYARCANLITVAYARYFFLRSFQPFIFVIFTPDCG